MATFIPTPRNALFMASYPRCLLLLFVALLGGIIPLCNLGTISSAIPDISGSLDVDTTGATWAAVACPVATALALPMAGHLHALLGLRKALSLALFILSLGSILCYSSQILAIILISRFIQGIGGGLLLALSGAILPIIFTPTTLKNVMRIRAISIGFGSCMSPIIGGFLVEYIGWKALFIFPLFASLPCLAIIWFLMTHKAIPSKGPFDWPSFLFLFCGVSATLVYVTYGQQDGWEAPHMLLWIYSGLAAFTLFIISSLLTETPYIQIKHLFNKRYIPVYIIGLLILPCIMGTRTLSIQYMRYVLNYSPAQIGKIFITPLIVFAILGLISQAIMSTGKTSLRVHVLLGMICFALGAWFLARLDANATWFSIVFPLCIWGGGYALSSSTIAPLALRNVTATTRVSAGAFLSTSRFLFSSLCSGGIRTTTSRFNINYTKHLAEQIHEGSLAVQNKIILIQGQWLHNGMTPTEAKGLALSMIAKSTKIQSNIFSYNNFFLVIMCLAIICGIIVIFCHKATPHPAAH